MTIIVNSVDELNAAAKALVNYSEGASFLVFEGTMGAGKTTFIKAFCEQIGVTDVVSSPTFSIVNEYNAEGVPVYHFDFYRLKSLDEAYDIGYEEYFYGTGICLVEWAEKVAPLLPEKYIQVDIESISENSRKINFSKIRRKD